MELQFRNAVGRRETKKEDENLVMLEPTRGNFRLFAGVVATLGLEREGFLAVQDATVDGEVKVFIGKGKAGVEKVDENNVPMVDKRGRKIYEVPGFGAALSETLPGTNVLKFSVTSSWDMLNGDTAKRKYFKLGEPVTATLPCDENGGVFTTVLYPLEFVKEEDKLQRKEGKTKVSETAAEEEGVDEVVETESTDGAPTTTNGDFFPEEDL